MYLGTLAMQDRLTMRSTVGAIQVVSPVCVTGPQLKPWTPGLGGASPGGDASCVLPRGAAGRTEGAGRSRSTRLVPLGPCPTSFPLLILTCILSLE